MSFFMCYILLPLKCFEGNGRELREKLNTFLLQVSEPWPESQHLYRATGQNYLISHKRLHFL